VKSKQEITQWRVCLAVREGGEKSVLEGSKQGPLKGLKIRFVEVYRTSCDWHNYEVRQF
jgi:hypothetical protein